MEGDNLAAPTRLQQQSPVAGWELIGSSDGLGWSDISIDIFRLPHVMEGWAAPATSDFTLNLLASGALQLEQRERQSQWRAYSLDPGEIVVYPLGLEQHELRWTARSAEPIDVVHIHIRADLLRRLAREMAVDLDPLARLSRRRVQDALLAQIGFALGQRLAEPSRGDILYAQSACQLILTHLLSHYTAVSPASTTSQQGLSQPQLRRVREYVDAHLDCEIAVEDLARQTGYSPYHFTRLFRQSIGRSPYQYVLQRRVARARLLLRESDLSHAEIALECGFANQSHLSRVFQRVLGARPSQVRREE